MVISQEDVGFSTETGETHLPRDRVDDLLDKDSRGGLSAAFV